MGSTAENPSSAPLDISNLENKSRSDLLVIAKDMGIANITTLKKHDIALKILQHQAEDNGHLFCRGIIEIMPDGYGFLRREDLLPSSSDVYVSQSQIRRFGLKTGDYIVGQGRAAKMGEKYLALLRVEAINGQDPENSKRRLNFNYLTPIYPNELINLESNPRDISTRLINLISPMGRGQRGMIVAPPKSGKTMLIKAIANAIATNYSDIHLMVLLIGERPEEVTDMRRSVSGEVIGATFDETEENQTRVAELALERAKRMVEIGKDVVILLDGITRLTRAYNLALPTSGRTLSGGLDPIALHPAKRFFGAARNIDGGGSLTILATCLVDTGSRMDDVIYEEFKGTGNMELVLDRRLAERRIFPAVDIKKSGTRRDELLMSANEYKQVMLLRRMVNMIADASASPTEVAERVINNMKKTKDNAEFLVNLAKDT